MAHYKVILAYDGTHFEGFQRQGRARTVQAEVEAALRNLGWQQRTIYAAGRTDAGVHATGQVIGFELEWRHSNQALVSALNANLPLDVAAKQAEIVSPAFHPRYSALARTYVYRIYTASERDPLRDRYAWRVHSPPVEVALLREAVSILPGSHDFSAFGAPPRKGGTTIRRVIRAEWQDREDELLFSVTANAFLYHMVRRMVYLQVLVGQKKLTQQDWQRAVLEAGEAPQGMTPPQGLTLVEILYPDPQKVDRRLELDDNTLKVSGDDDSGQDVRPEG